MLSIYFDTKVSWATFWVIFSQTHQATLSLLYVLLSLRTRQGEMNQQEQNGNVH
jgi:hypothetical protein